MLTKILRPYYWTVSVHQALGAGWSITQCDMAWWRAELRAGCIAVHQSFIITAVSVLSAVIKSTDRTLPCTMLNMFQSVEIESKGSTFPFHTYRMKPCTGGDFEVGTREGGIRPWGRTHVPLVTSSNSVMVLPSCLI